MRKTSDRTRRKVVAAIEDFRKAYDKAFPTQSTLADLTGLSVRTVRYAIQELRDEGYVITHRACRWHSNVYEPTERWHELLASHEPPTPVASHAEELASHEEALASHGNVVALASHASKLLASQDIRDISMSVMLETEEENPHISQNPIGRQLRQADAMTDSVDHLPEDEVPQGWNVQTQGLHPSTVFRLNREANERRWKREEEERRKRNQDRLAEAKTRLTTLRLVQASEERPSSPEPRVFTEDEVNGFGTYGSGNNLSLDDALRLRELPRRRMGL